MLYSPAEFNFMLIEAAKYTAGHREIKIIWENWSDRKIVTECIMDEFISKVHLWRSNMTVMRIYHFELFSMVMMQVNKCRFFTKKFLLKRSLKLLVILLYNIPATGLHYEKNIIFVCLHVQIHVVTFIAIFRRFIHFLCDLSSCDLYLPKLINRASQEPNESHTISHAACVIALENAKYAKYTLKTSVQTTWGTRVKSYKQPRTEITRSNTDYPYVKLSRDCINPDVTQVWMLIC